MIPAETREPPSPPAATAEPDLSDAGLEAAAREVVRVKLDALGEGWAPAIRARHGYRTPEEVFEAAMWQLVTPGLDWLDVGCGEFLFPTNPALGPLLAARAGLLAGVDPSENIRRNRLIQERFEGPLEAWETAPGRFDLVSLRMVAEHVTEPGAFVAALARLTAPGGRVVVYTVNRWALPTLVSDLTPFSFHHRAKRVLFDAQEERHTFPTAYRMNTRAELRRLFEAAGFAEERFLVLDDCRSLAKWKAGLRFELALRRATRALGLPYLDTCLLGIYRRSREETAA